MFFNARKNAYNAGDGPVRYLDGSSLARPLDAPKPQMMVMIGFVVAAAIIGGIFLFTIIDTVTHSAERTQASIEQNLARPASTESLPNLASLAALDDEGIRGTFAEAGFTVLDLTATEGDDAGVLDLVKLPDDVSELEAAAFYAKGISSLSAADATLLLNGSWRLTKDSDGSSGLRVKYADFSSGSVIAALQAAAAAEGFDLSAAGEPAEDEAGNTYLAGSMDANGTTYGWRISAIALSDVYNVKGLPETAVYVGIRISQ